jgi:hypothetical protein
MLFEPSVRFGSKADMTLGPMNAGFTSKCRIEATQTDVRFVPIADSCSAAKRILFDHFVGASHKLRRRHGEAERLPFKKDVLAPVVAFQLAFERGAVIEAVKA